MLPYYRYLVIWSGLYTVHGGFIDWTNDGLGMLSFSNELWNGNQYFNSPELQTQAGYTLVRLREAARDWRTAEALLGAARRYPEPRDDLVEPVDVQQVVHVLEPVGRVAVEVGDDDRAVLHGRRDRRVRDAGRPGPAR